MAPGLDLRSTRQSTPPGFCNAIVPPLGLSSGTACTPGLDWTLVLPQLPDCDRARKHRCSGQWRSGTFNLVPRRSSPTPISSICTGVGRRRHEDRRLRRDPEERHIGARCKISSHTFICEGVTIEDEVFVGHGVMFTNDLYPARHTPDGGLQTEADWEVVPTRVRRGASIGSNATIICGVTIGRGRAGRRRRGRDARRARPRDRRRRAGPVVGDVTRPRRRFAHGSATGMAAP